jgi:hypothetical protein
MGAMGVNVGVATLASVHPPPPLDFSTNIKTDEKEEIYQILSNRDWIYCTLNS